MFLTCSSCANSLFSYLTWKATVVVLCAFFCLQLSIFIGNSKDAYGIAIGSEKFTSFAGLGFITSISFIFVVGVFMSSWLGASVLSLGEWFIKRMPFVRHIYNASKQISAAISPGYTSYLVVL